MAADLTNLPKKYTFDDLLILPNASVVEPPEVNLATRFTKEIKLKIPIVSSPMDTVTESKLAIELAKLGGIGVIHRNMSVERQVREVRKVKESSLKVAAAIGPFDLERAKALEEAGVDAIVMDCAHAHNLRVVESAKKIKKHITCELIVGNIAVPEAVEVYREIADAFRVGLGAGSICTTRIITGVGVPQASAIHEVYLKAKEYGIPVIADGGIRNSGDMVKALALGADCVMLGNLLARTFESAGKIVDGRQIGLKGKFKLYRGMGARSVMEATDRYIGSSKRAAEGVEGLVPLVGSVKEVVSELVEGIRQGLGYIGAKNLEELKEKARFVLITPSSVRENYPHNVKIVPSEKWVELMKKN